jgi:hypothetical protein
MTRDREEELLMRISALRRQLMDFDHKLPIPWMTETGVRMYRVNFHPEEWDRFREVLGHELEMMHKDTVTRNPCPHVNVIVCPANDTFLARRGCLDCNEWLDPVGLVVKP